ERNHFIGVQSRVRLALEQLLDQRADLRYSRGTTDQHNFINLLRLQSCIFQRLFARSHRTLDDWICKLLELLTGDFAPVALAFWKVDVQARLVSRRQCHLCFDHGLANRSHSSATTR